VLEIPSKRRLNKGDSVKKIVVASKNPVKIQTTLAGFKRMFPNETFEIEGITVKSDVLDQPMSEKETLEGAINRANNASIAKSDGDYWVGIEGGIQETEGELLTFAWIVIKSKEGKFGKGKTGSFFLPNKVAQLIKQGKELGEADDIVFNKQNSKQANGAVGILTGDILTRTSFYEPAVILALIPFKIPGLY